MNKLFCRISGRNFLPFFLQNPTRIALLWGKGVYKLKSQIVSSASFSPPAHTYQNLFPGMFLMEEFGGRRFSYDVINNTSSFVLSLVTQGADWLVLFRDCLQTDTDCIIITFSFFVIMEAPDDPFPGGFDWVEDLDFEVRDDEDEEEDEPNIAPEGDDQQVRSFKGYHPQRISI